MRTIQVVLDEALLGAADAEAERQHVNRSQLIRDALAAHLARLRERELEEQHRLGYERHPVEPGEFDVWDTLVEGPEE